MDGIFWCKRIGQYLLRSQGDTNLPKSWLSSVLSRSLSVPGTDVPGEDYQEQAGPIKNYSIAVFLGLVTKYSSSC